MTSPESEDNSNFPFGQQIVWQPNPQWMAESSATAFMRRHGIGAWQELQDRACGDVAWFWDAVLKELDIRFATPYAQVVDLTDAPEFPRWCVGGRLNITYSCLEKWLETGAGERCALRWEDEDGKTRTLTYAELLVEVNRCANALQRMGIGQGDVVGLFMPMIPEIVVAFLAIIRVGAVVLPLFSGYGAGSISSRLVDAGARAVVTAETLTRRGRVSPMKTVLDEALQSAPTVVRVLVVGSGVSAAGTWQEGRDLWWHDALSAESPEAACAATDAEAPLMVIYTSGTTGAPKGAVHTHCGFPVKAAQDLSFCFDLKPGNVLFWITDMGWMMGPWEIFGALLIGATVVLFDGAPDYPDAGRVWSLVERHGVTHLGVSPSLVRALMSHGAGPVIRHDLSSLRLIGSTGSPWDPEAWQWLFANVLRSEKPILNYSGGTEISGGILCGNLFTPLKPCAFGGPVPGMDADVVDESGVSLRGAVGELVIRQPWIGMTRGFWRDRERYLDAYWRRWPALWAHGDFAAIDEDDQWYILGRSDDTIKVAGKRVGPAEVESILNAHRSVLESAAVGAPHPLKDQEIVAFCVLRPGSDADESLRGELFELVVRALGKPLTPRAILFVRALPRTRNGKVMRRVVRAAWLGEPAGDLSSLEDPAAVDAIREAK